MDLYRLVYVSKQATPMSREDIVQIINTSVNNNAERNLTGMLIYSERSFLQLLEGEMLPLNQIFERIVRDTRHDNVCMLEYARVSYRLFGDWDMKLVAADDYTFPRSIQLAAEGSPYHPFPLDRDLALELLLRVKHNLIQS